MRVERDLSSGPENSTWRPPAPWAVLRVCLPVVLAVAVAACIAPAGAGGPPAPAARGRPSTGVAHLVWPEPATIAAYVAAFNRGREAELPPLVSGYYRAELRRRGTTGRLSVLPRAEMPPAPPDEWLRFQYAGGSRDSNGITHVLYTSRPRAPGRGRPGTSVWRVDAAPDGTVLWIEPVFMLLDEEVDGPLAPVAPTADVAPFVAALPNVPPDLRARLPARAVFGVAAPNGDGYYGLELGERNGAPALVAFFGWCAGALVPGVWSFGDPAWAAPDGLPFAQSIRSPDDWTLLLNYAVALYAADLYLTTGSARPTSEDGPDS